jgi:hypothetical protein
MEGGSRDAPARRSAARDELIAEMNKRLGEFGMTATVKRGWQPYDPLVVTGAAMTYANITKAAQSEDDGGVAYAQQLRGWFDDDTELSDLPRPMYALAIISHWAEVARGYVSELDALYEWIDQIADAESPAEAKRLWGAYRTRYPPSLKYAEDAKMEWANDDPSGDDEQEKRDDAAMDIDEDDEENPGGALTDTRLRSGTNY